MRTPVSQFRSQLGTTPEQAASIDVLFNNPTFKNLLNYLQDCKAEPKADLGPLHLEVIPGLRIGGVERFGGYDPAHRTLMINPTKPEHLSNPSELVDTIVHEMIHAVDDLEADCVTAGSPPAPLGGAATVNPDPLQVRGRATTPEEEQLMRDLGPGASNPCEEFIDINAIAQNMVVEIIAENIKLSHVGRPTVTFVNIILRQDPTAMRVYETCRRNACSSPTPNGRRTAMANCSAEIIGRFLPSNLTTSLLPAHIHFDFDSQILRPDSKETLDLIARFLVAHPNTQVDITGHTDPVGPEEYNLRLGLRRARMVEQLLLARFVDASQINSIVSLGEEGRISTDSTEFWKDRRVEIVVH